MRTFQLGMWHPDRGSYEYWEEEKLAKFTETKVVVSIERMTLPMGGILLLVQGHKKEETICEK